MSRWLTLTFAPGSATLAVHPEARPEAGEPVVTKHLPGSFTGTALESALRERGVAFPNDFRRQDLAAPLVEKYREIGVELRGCDRTRAIMSGIAQAAEDDWYAEYLAPILAIRIVDSLDEAIAHGVPVLSTTAGAIPETVPTAAGVLVPPGDARALTKALARLLDDPAARRD